MRPEHLFYIRVPSASWSFNNKELNTFLLCGPVVRTVDNLIQWINPYPEDENGPYLILVGQRANFIHCIGIYPLHKVIHSSFTRALLWFLLQYAEYLPSMQCARARDSPQMQPQIREWCLHGSHGNKHRIHNFVYNWDYLETNIILIFSVSAKDVEFLYHLLKATDKFKRRKEVLGEDQALFVYSEPAFDTKTPWLCCAWFDKWGTTYKEEKENLACRKTKINLFILIWKVA